MALPSTAGATDISVKLEPGVAIPLNAPQSEVFGVGGGQSLKALFGLTPWLDIGPSASFVYLPASAEGAESGVVWGLGAGPRFKRPHDAESYGGISPWVDGDLLYIRTGDLDRFGLDAALGLSVPVGRYRTFWIGPFVRYEHVFQGNRAGFDNTDANILTIGVSLEFGSGIEREPPPLEAPAAAGEIVVTKDVPSCPDRDNDGIPDSVDRCPEVVGTADNYGCPKYDKIVVHPDKLELKEKLYFAWDQARLEEASFPVLDEVVQALKDNKGFRVQVEGHADSTGTDDHNQTLSEKRALAVLDYLAAHGIARDRLVSKGFSSSVPIDTNTTVAGRENNRRVEFVVHFVILNAGSAQ
ncbi:MAG: OmpA family protein [Myxococcota bacterium]|nr:OmpA family protein [Myxococcota bacterium]